MSGQGVEKDYEKAHDFFERAADKGNLTALYALGSIYMNGQSVEKDKHEARRLFKQGAKKGHVECQYALGVSYKYEDIEQEIQCFKLAAHQGHARAAFELALIYHSTSCTGSHYKSITKNNQKAFNHLKSIVDQDKNFLATLRKDYVLPKLFLSMMYFSGQGTLQNEEEGLKYYNSATDSKNDSAAVAHAYYWLRDFTHFTSIPAASYLKGLMCQEGKGTQQNYFEAAKNFGAAAKEGFLLATDALDNTCEVSPL